MTVVFRRVRARNTGVCLKCVFRKVSSFENTIQLCGVIDDQGVTRDVLKMTINSMLHSNTPHIIPECSFCWQRSGCGPRG